MSNTARLNESSEIFKLIIDKFGEDRKVSLSKLLKYFARSLLKNIDETQIDSMLDPGTEIEFDLEDDSKQSKSALQSAITLTTNKRKPNKSTFELIQIMKELNVHDAGSIRERLSAKGDGFIS